MKNDEYLCLITYFSGEFASSIQSLTAAGIADYLHKGCRVYKIPYESWIEITKATVELEEKKPGKKK